MDAGSLAPSSRRRVVSLWLPRLAAERVMRREGLERKTAVAIIGPVGGASRVVSVSEEAEAAGVRPGMGLADARAVRPDLTTRPADPAGEASFLRALTRWAERYTPWIGHDGRDGLALDVTGCAHLFGGEAAMLEDMVGRLRAQGLTPRAACADARGAAWALARFGAGVGASGPGGDAIAAEAPATRVRAPARPAHARPRPAPPRDVVIAPVGGARAALARLPIAALRLPTETVEALARLGVRTIEDAAVLPRGAFARRFGAEALRRLDQAFGAEPEPVAASRPPPSFAVRLGLPDPIGRTDDVTAALDRLLARLCVRLETHGAGARRLRLTLRRVDRSDAAASIGLARPSRDRAAIAELFARPLADMDAGFGIDALRLEAIDVEPLAPLQHKGHFAAGADAAARLAPGGGDGFAALLGRLGNRLGFDALERLLPAESHVPARAFTVASAAYAAPHEGRWPIPPGPRPLTLLRPEPAEVEADNRRPTALRWRRRELTLACAIGPERIAPEWWLDDPDWREGPRDYWRVESETGLRLWLFHTPGSTRTARWFVEGVFA